MGWAEHSSSGPVVDDVPCGGAVGLVVARERVVPCPGGSKGVHAHVPEAKLLLEVDRRQGGQRSPQRVPCTCSSTSSRAAWAPTQLDHSIPRRAGGPKSSSNACVGKICHPGAGTLALLSHSTSSSHYTRSPITWSLQ